MAFISNAQKIYDTHRFDKLSLLIWDLNWQEFLPQRLVKSNVDLVATNREAFDSFAQESFATIYGPEYVNQVMQSLQSPSRNRYYDVSSDFIFLKQNDSTIGGFVGTPLDWRTYYIRNITILKTHQGLGIYQDFLNFLISTLRPFNIEALDVDIAPDNERHFHILSKFGFKKAATLNESAWGKLIRLRLQISKLYPSEDTPFHREVDSASEKLYEERS